MLLTYTTIKYDEDTGKQVINKIYVFKYQAEVILQDVQNPTFLNILNKIKSFELDSTYPNLIIECTYYMKIVS